MSSYPRPLFMAMALVLSACAQSPKKSASVALSAEERAQAQCAPVALPESKTFSAQRYDSGLPNSGQWRDGFDLADMNGDGHLDLLHGPPRKGRMLPHIFLGDGKGRFSLWEEAHFPPLPYDYGDIIAADFNGDGRRDIAISAHLRGLAVMINEAGGHYAPWGEGLMMRAPSDAPTESTFASRSIAVSDWNRDGKPDLLALNEGPSRFAAAQVTTAGASEALALFINRSGYWERKSAVIPLQAFGDDMAIGDVNGDGLPDAMLGTQVEGVRALLQLGDSASFNAKALRSLPKDAAITAVALHDLDGDRRDEIINAARAITDKGYCTSVQVIDTSADGIESATLLWREVSKDPVVVLRLADLNRDGRQDLLALRQQGSLMVFLATDSGFARDLQLSSPTEMQSCQLFDAAVADLDGDAQFELIASYAGDAAGADALRCDRNGGFASWQLR